MRERAPQGRADGSSPESALPSPSYSFNLVGALNVVCR